MKLPKPAVNMAESLYNSLRTAHVNGQQVNPSHEKNGPQDDTTRRDAWATLVRKARSKLK